MSAATPGAITCKELVEVVTDYFEDMLPLAERRRLELHVRTCTGCRAYLAQMRAVIRLSGRLVEEGLPLHVRTGVLDTFREWNEI